MAADLSPAALVGQGPAAVVAAEGDQPRRTRERYWLRVIVGRAIGRRDYAMIITLLRLGLRRGELARLTLDDIDWRAGELVVRGKGAVRIGCRSRPMSAKRSRRYLRRGRPSERPARGVSLRPGSVCADRSLDGRLDRASRVPACRDPGGRLASAAAHDGVRDGPGRGSDRADRPGAAASQPAEHRDLRARGRRAATATRRAVANGGERAMSDASSARRRVSAVASRAGVQARACTGGCCRSSSRT